MSTLEVRYARSGAVNIAYQVVGDGPVDLLYVPGRPDVSALGVELRAGVHTGECERDGARVTGIAVHIGARIAALAGPGEVLISSTVKDRVAGSPLRFRQWGMAQLRGVEGELALYSVPPEDAPAQAALP